MLSARLVEGIPPNYDVDLGIPDPIIRRYQQVHERIVKYFHSFGMGGYNPPLTSKNLGNIEKAISKLIPMATGLGIDLPAFDIPLKWDQWDIPESFDILDAAIERTIEGELKTASTSRNDMMALRVAARFRTPLVVQTPSKGVKLTLA